jgi:hypothetical protein
LCPLFLTPSSGTLLWVLFSWQAPFSWVICSCLHPQAPFSWVLIFWSLRHAPTYIPFFLFWSQSQAPFYESWFSDHSRRLIFMSPDFLIPASGLSRILSTWNWISSRTLPEVVWKKSNT